MKDTVVIETILCTFTYKNVHNINFGLETIEIRYKRNNKLISAYFPYNQIQHLYIKERR